jgi:hypothetical protein
MPDSKESTGGQDRKRLHGNPQHGRREEPQALDVTPTLSDRCGG